MATPDPGQFFRVIEEHKVCGMFTAPTAIRAIEREDPNGEYAAKYNLDSLRTLFVAGEHCDYRTRLWAEKHFRAPVLDNWWQTETGRDEGDDSIHFLQLNFIEFKTFYIKFKSP